MAHAGNDAAPGGTLAAANSSWYEPAGSDGCVNLEEITGHYSFYRKLRQSQTNTFIVSLAFSDFLLGVAVMPFTSTFFLLNKHWIFGTLYCRIWLAVDVWLCTASILNLVAISYERYLAIKKPMSYSRYMTYWRTRMMLVGVWILALMISIPGLITNDGTPKPKEALEREISHSALSASNATCKHSNATPDMLHGEFANGTTTSASCVQRIDCSISESSPFYIVYSACGSFFLPAAVMLAFYVEIYKTARRTLRAMHTGQLLSKGQNSKDVVVLRVHIGGHAVRAYDAAQSRYFRNGHDMQMQRQPSINDTIDEVGAGVTNNHARENGDNKRLPETALTRGALTPDASSDAAFTDLLPAVPTGAGQDERNAALCPSEQDTNTPFYTPTPQRASNRMDKDKDKDKNSRTPLSKQLSKPLPNSGRSLNTQSSRANRETKAAKTVAIICGSFLLCWLGFFCAYLLSAFCDRCVPDLVWDILFWLGYINSACNPCVYALFSRDFRTGFSRLLRCLCCWRASQRRRFTREYALRQSRQHTRRFETGSSAVGHAQHHVNYLYRRTSASQSPLDEVGSTRAPESGV